MGFAGHTEIFIIGNLSISSCEGAMASEYEKDHFWGALILSDIELAVLMLGLMVGYAVIALMKSQEGMLLLKNPYNGRTRKAPVGFSWTTQFFWGLPALFRQHWSASLFIIIVCGLTGGLACFVFPWIYNKLYIKHLINDAYLVDTIVGDQSKIERSLGFKLPMLDPE